MRLLDEVTDAVDDLNRLHIELCKLVYLVDNVTPTYPSSIPAAECSPSDGLRFILAGETIKTMRWLLQRLKTHTGNRGETITGLNDKLAGRLADLRVDIERQREEMAAP